ncbi:hypothetical protein GALMADRAFT_1139043 [Galerina marginata CBS 339.88]|uniref:Uncharacterized protein n=1 Tax=Galerina marginata (strain CBS 339.88) TaxID=685588 RepID=A0A067S9V6_GALM3|nr:hypothetical protein GALMADRAFT_1139043 [Galerina marginata CBS 339.88]
MGVDRARFYGCKHRGGGGKRVLSLPEPRARGCAWNWEFSRLRKIISSPPSFSVIHLATVGLGGSHIDLRVAAVSCLFVILGVILPTTSRVISLPSTSIPQDSLHRYRRLWWFRYRSQCTLPLLPLVWRFVSQFSLRHRRHVIIFNRRLKYFDSVDGCCDLSSCVFSCRGLPLLTLAQDWLQFPKIQFRRSSTWSSNFFTQLFEYTTGYPAFITRLPNSTTAFSLAIHHSDASASVEEPTSLMITSGHEDRSRDGGDNVSLYG